MNGLIEKRLKRVCQRARFVAPRLVFVAAGVTLLGIALNTLMQPNLPQSIETVLKKKHEALRGQRDLRFAVVRE
jgi:hypothetical protein